MNPITRFFLPKSVKAAIGILDELEYQFDTEAFRIIRPIVEQRIIKNQGQYNKVLNEGTPVRFVVMGMLADLAADHVESGQYHVYRGVLDPMGPGQDFLNIFDKILREGEKLGYNDKETVDTQMAAIRKNIKSVG
ncbi:hypothetical protein [Mucisphaera sp.]|uniref:hypothetical protein n=1 Tax=Mucisphaera sp. TaxID=2913024 RepID=UPI003D111B1B